mmetsp:Transcript_8469/g.24410  ORF Transcript_8469/g.24410 Transcript_8469/m.24410 type:complete len:247 (+) Transcript_8469:842-1582(+)
MDSSGTNQPGWCIVAAFVVAVAAAAAILPVGRTGDGRHRPVMVRVVLLLSRFAMTQLMAGVLLCVRLRSCLWWHHWQQRHGAMLEAPSQTGSTLLVLPLSLLLPFWLPVLVLGRGDDNAPLRSGPRFACSVKAALLLLLLSLPAFWRRRPLGGSQHHHQHPRRRRIHCRHRRRRYCCPRSPPGRARPACHSFCLARIPRWRVPSESTCRSLVWPSWRPSRRHWRRCRRCFLCRSFASSSSWCAVAL